MANKTVHVRMPVHVYKAIREQAEAEGVPLSQFVREVVDNGLPPLRKNTVNVAPKRTAITYTAREDTPNRVRQAALEEGVSSNDWYVRTLCNALGIKPCHVVVVKNE